MPAGRETIPENFPECVEGGVHGGCKGLISGTDLRLLSEAGIRRSFQRRNGGLLISRRQAGDESRREVGRWGYAAPSDHGFLSRCRLVVVTCARVGDPLRMRILLILLALVASASAKVIVYKGSVRTALPDGIAAFGSLPHAYVLFDFTTKQGYFILYYTVNGKKGSSTQLPLENSHYVARIVSATKTIGTFSYALDTSSGTDVGVNMLYLRGRERPLILTTGGAVENYPRTLTGLFREVQFIGIPSVYELNFTLSFDPVHTQIANNAFQSGADTVSAIQNELMQKGF